MALQCVIKPKMWLGLKQILLYVGLLLCVLLQVCRSKTQLFCPTVCSCDLHEQRNRAICSAKRLISANIEMPKSVEILDLSYNDITNIDEDCFKTNVHLLNLTLAHNAIRNFHVDAFATLRHLQALDLAYNRLEYVDEHLLEGNPRLHYVNLEGNKLASLERQPLLRSSSLRILNLRNSQINQVSMELLSALPQLRELNLAQNMLITLSGNAFYAPRLLAKLVLDENPLNCDRALSKMATALQQRGMSVSMSDCPFELEDHNAEEDLEQQPSLKFERIEQTDSVAIQEPQSVLAVWRELPDDSSEEQQQQEGSPLLPSHDLCEGSREQLCMRYHSCLERVSHTLLDNEQPDSGERTHSYDEDDVQLAFAIGAATGICMVIFIISFALCLKSCCEMRRRSSSSSSNDSIAAQEDLAHDPENELQAVATEPLTTTTLPPPSPPSRIRMPRRSNPSRHSHGNSRALVIRQPYGPQDNFVSRLFGRPARQQYYRTLNQNAATLIRSLSRNNLFNRQSESNSPTTPTSADSEGLPTARFYTDVEQMPARPETPPPKYGDVVVIEHCDSK